ncbi:MAG TPA: isoprenylcysteine carboxylmethyltransferase family protein [Gemmatimonadaceae bacterium]|jgi:protein-S-isoprenylcysteine O-methyltransferase Ste14|nr:isoprenylcysteine carboxylmethyltransferase family protein [Gemmatimonadaceae bacterium]
MAFFSSYLIPALWVAWLAGWWLAARNTKQTARRESLGSRLSYTVPLGIGVWLLISRRIPWPALNARFVPLATWPYVVGVALVVVGLAFATWARVYLGRNWSASVTLKRDHELVRSGPYRWVRNPIYTGILVALAGSALARGQWSGVLAVVIAFGSFWYKARLEERVMHAAFGESYDAYRREVKSLIPFVL